MAQTEFLVTYDGPALTDGRMPVRDLAPALLALGNLFAEASLVAYPDREPVALDIKATAGGSFDVHLILHAVDAWDKVVDLFSSDTATALLQLKDYIIASGAGLLWLVSRLRGRRIKVQQALDAGRIRLTLDNETAVDLPVQVWDLYQNIEVRKNARQFVDPLTRDGINSVEFYEERGVTLRLDKIDVSAFDVPEIEDMPLLDQELEMFVAITSVTFAKGNKWRFTAGDDTFYAAIEDPEFLRRVDLGEAFRKGDMLRCRMRLVQSRRGDGLHTERHVVRVIEHIPRTIQLRLPPASIDSGLDMGL